MSSRRPFLVRLASLALLLLALTSLCRSRGVDEDLPPDHCISGLLFPVPPRVPWPSEITPLPVTGARVDAAPAARGYSASTTPASTR